MYRVDRIVWGRLTFVPGFYSRIEGPASDGSTTLRLHVVYLLARQPALSGCRKQRGKARQCILLATMITVMLTMMIMYSTR